MATQIRLPGGGVRTVESRGELEQLVNNGGKIVGGEYPLEYARYATPEANAHNEDAERNKTGAHKPFEITYDANGIGYDASGKPVQKAFESFLQGDPRNPTLGSNLTATAGASLLPGYEDRLKNINLNKDVLTKLRGEALAAPGTGAWEQMMMGRQGVEEAMARDKAMKTSRQGAANAFSDLATRGGITPSAAGRLARGAGEQTALARQNVIRQGILDRFGIGTEAENQRLTTARMMPGMEVQALQPELEKTKMWGAAAESDRNNAQQVQQFNISNILKQKAVEDAAKLGKYKEMATMYGAGKTADAQAGGGKVICTELHRQGFLPDEIYNADSAYGKLMPVEVVQAYHAWALPLVRVMKRSRVVVSLVSLLAIPWAYEMAFRMGAVKKGNVIGKLLLHFGVPVSNFIGSRILKNKLSRMSVA